MRGARGARAVRIGAAALWLGLAAAAAPAQQSPFFGQAILGYNLFNADYLTANGFQQLYDVGYDRQLSEPLHFRLFFRGTGVNAHQDYGSAPSSNSFWLLQPTAELDYSLPTLQFVGRYDYASTTSHYSNQTESTRLVQRAVGTLTWSPEALPSLSIQGEQRRNQESSANIDQAETLVSEAIFYTWRALTVGEVVQYITQDLYNTPFHETQFNAQVTGQYANSFADGRVSVNANAIVGYRQIEQTVQSGDAASVPNQVLVAAAGYVHDETPLDARDAPPTPTPALVDNDYRASAGVSLGPDGASFQNLVFDMGRYVALDTFRVLVRDAGGNLVQAGGLVAWDLYTSENNLDWTSAGLTQTRFLASMAAYEITFPQLRARYFKLVSFGTNTLPAFVTEVQAFFHTELSGPGVTRTTDVRFLNANVNASGRPTDWLTLSYNGLFNDYKTKQPNRPDFASTDSDQFLSAEFLPTQALDLVLRYEKRKVSPSGQEQQNLQGYYGNLTYTFNPSLITTVEASKTQETGLHDIRSSTLRVSQYARLLPTFTIQGDLGTVRQELRLEGLKSKSDFFDVIAYTQLTRSLQLNLNASFQKTHLEGPAAGVTGGLDTRYERYYADLLYRPSGRLSLGARYGYTLAQGIRAQIRSFRVEWYPFAGGTVGIGTIFEQDVDTNHEFRRFRRLQILPIWMINPHATLNVNYNLFTLRNAVSASGPGTDQTARQFLVTLTLTL